VGKARAPAAPPKICRRVHGVVRFIMVSSSEIRPVEARRSR
jgi:hypothetical protein